jgi:hypothetical protein
MRVETKRMMLHSGETIVKYYYNGKLRQFSAKSELPEDFQAVLDYRPGLNQPQPKQTRSPLLANRRFKS